MDYEEKDFLIKNIDRQIDNINNSFKNISDKIKKYQNKYNIINDQIEMLKKKTHLNLDDTTKLLRFQNNLIFNEITYLKNIKQIMNSQINSELYKLSDKLAIIAISILNLNKDINQDNLSHINRSKKTDTIGKKIKSINNNFIHIKDLLLKIKNYNKQINNDMMKGNYHCKTLDMDISIKRIHIFIEYKRYASIFEAIIEHFNELSISITKQINHKTLFNFLVSNDEIEDEEIQKVFSRMPSLENLDNNMDDIPLNNIETIITYSNIPKIDIISESSIDFNED
jgi:hypothetical protein